MSSIKKTMFAGYRPIFCNSRIFGLTPFSIICNSNGEVQSCKVKVFDCVWLVVSICVYVLLVIFNYYLFISVISFIHHQSNNQYRQTTFLVLNVGNSILVLLNFVFYILFCIINMCNRDKFLNILKMFEHFDKQVSHDV